MKKPLMVLATACALTQTAQAQSGVTLYGKIDLGLVMDSGNAAGKAIRISSGVSGGSRLGFRGEEDLGSGTKVALQLETGFCADSAANAPNFCTGSNNFMGRQAHIDLRTAYGSLVVGRQYSFGYNAASDLDPFENGYAGQVENTDEKGNYLVDTSGTRLNNSAAYTTPTFSGFSAGTEIAFGEQTGDWRANRELGAMAKYDQGPIYATVTYYDVSNPNGQGDARRATTGGATYDLGALKLHGVVQKVAGEPTGSSRIDALNLMAGVTIPVYSGNVLASFVRHDDRTSLDQDASQWGLGYVHALSKRTSLYTAYAHISNRHGAGFLVGNATDDGTGDKAFNLGVTHKF
jgi:predicted porin